MNRIKIAIAGVGNCASSLVQGIHYYKDKQPEDATGLMHWEIGGFKPGDIEVVAAFDIDKRKVGKDVNTAIFSLPNCTKVFCPDLPPSGVSVQMGKILDGVSEHMREYEDKYAFVPADLDANGIARSVGRYNYGGWYGGGSGWNTRYQAAYPQPYQLTDLTRFLPGFLTSRADVAAVVAREARPDPERPLGRIDEQARERPDVERVRVVELENDLGRPVVARLNVLVHALGAKARRAEVDDFERRRRRRLE